MGGEEVECLNKSEALRPQVAGKVKNTEGQLHGFLTRDKSNQLGKKKKRENGEKEGKAADDIFPRKIREKQLRTSGRESQSGCLI